MTRSPRAGYAPSALRYAVNPNYLKLMHIPLLEGRFFSDADNEHASRVIVVDESFAQRFFPGQDPIGKHIYFRRRAPMASAPTRSWAWWGM